MTRCRFLDADGTIFSPGTNDWLPGVEQKLKEWSDAGDMLIMFTMRPYGLAVPWLKILKDAGVHIAGYMQKPMADEYYLYDDHLVEGHQSICCEHKDYTCAVRASDAPKDAVAYCNDCNIYLYSDEWHRSIFR